MASRGLVTLAERPLDSAIDNLNLAEQNAVLRNSSAQDIVRWALSLNEPIIASTSFSPNSAVMLHLVSSIKPDLPIIWVDSGYNTRDTYLVAEKLIADLKLNMHVYTPHMSAARRDALMGIPMPGEDESLHREFTRQVKLEPFAKALDEFKPRIWLAGIRAEETAFRKTLNVLSWDSRGILKVAPLFHLQEAELDAYMERYQLPSCRKYFDPTKVADDRECGLHTGA
jgi:phosphoadenosine phosphosulfate reductase